MKGLVASDLHIGKPLSTGVSALQSIQRRAHGLDYIILNGDIIEGPNIPAPNEKRAKEIITGNLILLAGFVQSVIDKNPGTKIVYIQGNHDSMRYVDEKLHDLACHFPGNFQYEPNHFRLGDTLFLHGDMHIDVPASHRDHFAAAIKYRLGGQAFIGPGAIDRECENVRHDSRFKELSTIRTTPSANLAHAVKNVLSPHILSPVIFPIELMAAAILETFHRHDPSIIEGVRHIFIGHVHYNQRKAHEVDGIEFHVTGPAIRGVSCLSYEFHMEGSNLRDIRPIACHTPASPRSR